LTAGSGLATTLHDSGISLAGQRNRSDSANRHLRHLNWHALCLAAGRRSMLSGLVFGGPLGIQSPPMNCRAIRLIELIAFVDLTGIVS
jgi:hypothetical protein